MSESWIYTPNALMPEGENLPQGVVRYGAHVSYDGSDYCGWQRQSHSPSVQEPVEYALSKVANSTLKVSCAGRTDTGVHGTYQIIHFDSLIERSPDNWVRGANANLPPSIRLHWVADMGARFHARFSATARTYRYLVANTSEQPSILHSGLTWQKGKIDVTAMNAACEALLGEQDYSAFRAANCQSLSCFRNVHRAKWTRVGDYLVFEIKANAFLLHMVRNIVGSMLEVGLGRQPSSWIGELLASKNRALAAPTASPKGLYLVGVDYPEKFILPPSPIGPLFFGAMYQ